MAAEYWDIVLAPLLWSFMIWSRFQMKAPATLGSVLNCDSNDALGKVHYKILILSARGGTVQTSSAVALVTKPIAEVSPGSIDTLLIAGGDECGLRELVADGSVRRWTVKASKSARRFGSVCSGAFVLAEFGLLQNRRVTTHWSQCSSLAERWPDVQVEKNALFVNDGALWTSAGVTAGINMSLEMVAADLGNTVAHAVAKRLVLYARRPGYQSQFSTVLDAQSHADAPFASLIHWMRENLAEQLDVPRLAGRVMMS